MAAHTSLAPQRHQWNTTRIIAGLIVGGLMLLIVFVATFPPARRWIANPAEQPAVVGTTAIEVRGDWFQNHLYAPSVVQVPAGSTVQWTFNDRGTNGMGELVKHNVVGEGWASPVLAEGVYEHTFTTPGTYRYTCTLHRYMDGVVVVTQ